MPKLKQFASGTPVETRSQPLPETAAASPAPQKQPSFFKTLLKLAALAFAAIFVVGLLFALLGSAAGGFGGTAFGGTCIARIQLNGEIAYSSSGGLFASETTAEELMQEIEKADEEGRVGAILLEVNSPGGSAVASKDLFDALQNAKKPSVAYLKEVAASGGYYVASAADYIVANPNTVTGSIGARTSLLNYAQLFEKLGLKEESIQSGELKDIGAGYRNLTEEERGILQELILEIGDNFAEDVYAAREKKLDKTLFSKYLDARVLTASQALKAGLVDEIGGKADAESQAVTLAKPDAREGEALPFCEFKPKRGLLDLLYGAAGGFGTEFAKGLKSELQRTSTGAEYK